MKTKWILVISATYMAILGVGFMFLPRQIGIGAVPEDAPPELIAYLRLFGAPFLGIAVLNWMARNAEHSAARNAIITGNIVGFAGVALMDVWGVFSGDARPIAKLFLVIHLLLAAAFILVGYAAFRSRHSS